nr:ABC-three component system middle component 7 [Limosilactobacillus ingluviei]
MKMPSKVTSFRESSLYKMLVILKKLDARPMKPEELLKSVNNQFEDVGEFLETLDLLYMLNKISVNDEGVLVRA